MSGAQRCHGRSRGSCEEHPCFSEFRTCAAGSHNLEAPLTALTQDPARDGANCSRLPAVRQPAHSAAPNAKAHAACNRMSIAISTVVSAAGRRAVSTASTTKAGTETAV